MAQSENKAKKKDTRAKTTRDTSAGSASRYPQWKIDLFHVGIIERRGASASDLTGRALRAPGA